MYGLGFRCIFLIYIVPRYNLQSHPLPFIKASTVVAPKKATKDKPDFEEAIEESEDDEELIADKDVKKEDDEEDLDLSKDKYVKQAKKKRAAPNKTATKKAPTSKKGKGRANESEEEEDFVISEEDTKPTKGRGSKAKASGGKGRAKK